MPEARAATPPPSSVLDIAWRRDGYVPAWSSDDS